MNMSMVVLVYQLSLLVTALGHQQYTLNMKEEQLPRQEHSSISSEETASQGHSNLTDPSNSMPLTSAATNQTTEIPLTAVTTRVALDAKNGQKPRRKMHGMRRRDSQSDQQHQEEEYYDGEGEELFENRIKYEPVITGDHKEQNKEQNQHSTEFLFPLTDEEQQKQLNGDDSDNGRRTAPLRDLSNSIQVAHVPLMRLTKDVLAMGRYDIRVRPVVDHARPLKIHISMSLYQIIEVNEPAQNIKMNVWMIQKWRDEMLHWDPREYDMINSTILPHEVLWIPDTYLYNSVVMNAEETERYMNIRADSLFWEGEQGSNMSFLYPAIYTVTCRLNIRYFPYDQQNCTLTISSWTNSKSALDYYADSNVNLASFIANEEWDVMSFRIFRHEYKYACCPEPWVILEASLVIRRKPLYYVINLIIPTSIITLVAITGFFTPASTADDRTEKINLGITTLLAMSILMLMVSDQMPTTSEFVPLIAWFYLSIIIIISIGTFLTSVILSIQGRRQYGKLPALWIRFLFFVKLCHWLCLSVPPPLLTLWEEMNDHPLATLQRKREEADLLSWKKKPERTTKSTKRSSSKKSKEAEGEDDLAGEDQRQKSFKNSQRRRQTNANQQSGERGPARGEGNGKYLSANIARIEGKKKQGCGLQRQAALSDRSADGCSESGGQGSPTISLSGSGRRSPSMRYSKRIRAKKNWLRVSSIASKRSIQSSPRSPRSGAIAPPPPLQLNVLNSSRRSSGAMSNWGNAIDGLGVSVACTPRPSTGSLQGARQAIQQLQQRTKSFCASAEVNSMKVKRQCSLEWEFLATILDRLFLIIFSLTTVIVTFGIMITGRVAQWQYEQAALELEHNHH